MPQTVLTTQTPSLPNEPADLLARTFGYEWQSTVNGSVTGGRYYGPQTNQPATVKAKLFALTGEVLLASKVLGATATGWNSFTFDAPVSITAGTTYVISYYMSGDGRYPVTPSGLTTDIVNGNLKALANRGRHKTGSGVDDFPLNLNSDLFFADINFEPTTIAGTGRANAVSIALVTGRKMMSLAGSAFALAAPHALAGNIRPATGVCTGLGRSLHRRHIARPNTGTVTRPDTGTVTRPFIGTVIRP